MFLALVPMIVCAQCHPAIVARYAASPMARTSGLVDAPTEPAGQFFHAASGTRFDIVKSKNRLELDWKQYRQPLDFFIGSRRMGRSYGFIENGYFYQAPVGYYANRRIWDMAPGYENDRKPDFNRPITSGCLFCHASGAIPLSGTINRYADVSCLRGVSCERCHGDPSAHIAHPQRGNIVNPQKLRAAERDSVCEQCHLAGEARFPQPGRRLVDFRPGQRLSTYLAVFVAGGDRLGIRVNSHAEALSQSRCRRASGEKLWCGTCHDPHGQRVDYRARCLGCHAAAACPVVRNRSTRIDADCIGCHMPKAQAYDGGHSVFTDHSIPRHAPYYSTARKTPESLEAYYPVDPASPTGARDWGIAWAQVAENYASPDALENAWPLLRAAAGSQPRDPLLYAKIAGALESAQKTKEAKNLYKISLVQDPQQVDVLVRLSALYERSGDPGKAAALRKRAAAILPRMSR
ncbi:MAG: multiheme c-type cytochrome [Bryobacteraceae bacterium]